MALYLFSGKGGVGKTHLATSFAWSKSQAGRRVLLVEFSSSGQYSEFFSKKVSYEPILLSKNLNVASWTGIDCLKKYVGRNLKSQSAASFFLEIPWVKVILSAAPGLKEISILGDLTNEYREGVTSRQFDDLIFDAPSTGHFESLLRTPEALSSLVGGGRMKEQCLSISNVLQNSPEVKFVIVSDGSAFSEKESKELKAGLQKIYGKKREVMVLQNFSEKEKVRHFKNINTGKGWLADAKTLSASWKGVFDEQM